MANYKTRQQEAFEELEITHDELNEISEAFKKEEFRKLFSDYVTEITDPENRKTFESEIKELERERGNDVTFIHPQPGYVIKTSVDGSKKAFINVCSNDNIGKPTAIPDCGGLRWSIPYTQAPPREDFDNNKNLCLVCDVVFHPDTIRMSLENKKFKEMVTETAMNAVEESYKFVLDKQNKVYPKTQFKGFPQATVIRRKSKTPSLQQESDDVFEIPNYPYAPINEEHNIKPKETNFATPDKQNPYTTPKYLIKQRRHVDFQDCTNSITSKMNVAIPNELVVEIELPLIKSASSVTLDVTEKSLKLISEKPAKYKLDITLPYSVNEDEGNAKFDCSTKKLTITLIVKQTKCFRNIIETAREDSGVDSDLGSCSRSTGSSSEDEPIREEELVTPIQNQTNESSVNTSSEKCDSGYRTSSESDEFLSSDKHYILPEYNLNTLQNDLAFTFHVQNVEPDSVESKYLDNDSGFHLKFISIGSGFFPLHYSFFVKFTSNVKIYHKKLDVEVWDNNVIAQVTLIPGCDKEVVEYSYGVDEKSLSSCKLPDSVHLVNNIQKTENEYSPTETKVEVVKFEEDNVVFEITNLTSSIKISDDNRDNNLVGNCTENVLTDEIKTSNEKEEENNNVDIVVDNSLSSGLNKGGKNVEDKNILEKKAVGFLIDDKVNGAKDVDRSSNKDRNKFKKHDSRIKGSPRSILRTLSESQSDKCESKPYRGILKVGRSLSESSADDYHWSSSSVEYSDTDLIGVEKAKKTVRFNDSVSKKTYRPNSSILGQKKKNQRKAKNKKRSQERRASESENSEGEQDESKYTNRVNWKSDEETSESQSDISQSDISQSDVSESEDGMKPEYKPESMALAKRHNHKRGGKKSARKSAFTAKIHMELI